MIEEKYDQKDDFDMHDHSLVVHKHKTKVDF